MRRTILACAGVLLSIVALGSDSPKEYDDKTEAQDIHGTWQTIAIRPRAAFGDGRVVFGGEEVRTFQGSKWTSSGGKPAKTGTYTIDASQKPAHLTLMYSDSDGKTSISSRIYRLNGDTLTIAYWEWNPSDKRPQNFDNEWLVVITYKRMK